MEEPTTKLAGGIQDTISIIESELVLRETQFTRGVTESEASSTKAATKDNDIFKNQGFTF